MIFLVELLRRALVTKISTYWYVVSLLVDIFLLLAIVYFVSDFGVILVPLYLWLLATVYSGVSKWHLYIVATIVIATAVMTFWFNGYWLQNQYQLLVALFVLAVPSLFIFFYRRIKNLVLIDPLTSLPNRMLFQDRLDQALKICRRNAGKAALLFMDLDGFKQVNDTLGHNVGDQLLKEVSGRLRNVVRNTDTIARLGGDEFAIILSDIHGSEVPVRIAEKILAKFEGPYHVNGRQINVGISIGIALCPDHADERNDLIRFSDVAMYAAKKDKAGYVVYSDEYNKAEIESLRLVADLRAAIKEDRLELVYQPKVNLHTKKVESVEALIRWEHAELGRIPPIKFVAMAENSVLINELTEWVIQTALRNCSQWERDGFPISVSINVSARNLQNEKLMIIILAAIKNNRLEADRVILEITETSLMAQSDITIKNLVGLSMMGVNLSIDDFGTGHASLVYVQKLPIREIKIDRQFVGNIMGDGRDKKIVQSIIHLAHDIDCRVVAEGVESHEIMVRLREMGCDLAQGFYIAQPMSSDVLLNWLANYES